MQWRARRSAVLAWLPWVLAAAAIATGVEVTVGNHIARRTVRPAPEPTWSWDTKNQIDVCLSLRTASGTSAPGEANLRIEGRVSGFGAISPGSPDPIDRGNIIACSEEPQSYIEVEDGDRQSWRILYALDGRAAPALRLQVGSPVHFRFDSASYAGQTTSFMLLDDAGPLVGAVLTHGPRPEDGRPFSINWGRVLGKRESECGQWAARALQVTGDITVSAVSGQTVSVGRHGVHYRFWNARSIEAIAPHCVDADSWVSWFLWRE